MDSSVNYGIRIDLSSSSITTILRICLFEVKTTSVDHVTDVTDEIMIVIFHFNVSL